MRILAQKAIAVVLVLTVVPTLTWAQTGTGPLDVTKFDMSSISGRLRCRCR